MLSRQREDAKWVLRSLRRRLFVEQDQQDTIAAYSGLVHQAFHAVPFAPRVSSDLWDHGRFRASTNLPAFYSPAFRERENSSHHYGHDVQLKRHARLPLIGTPLPLLLEHGLKVSRASTFERPKHWSKAFLCMGPLRARWVQERFGIPAVPIGPWIAYARSLLSPEREEEIRGALGRTLLVVLAHSWDSVERRMDLKACLRSVHSIQRGGDYQSVILLRHWKDEQWPELPPDWIVACNGHRSNPWFLDSLRSLMLLSDGLATNAFGTHLGYGFHLGQQLHWIAVPPDQDLRQLKPNQADVEAQEWVERQRLSATLERVLMTDAGRWSAGCQQEVRNLLDPYWGFEYVRSPEVMKKILRSRKYIDSLLISR